MYVPLERRCFCCQESPDNEICEVIIWILITFIREIPSSDWGFFRDWKMYFC